MSIDAVKFYFKGDEPAQFQYNLGEALRDIGMEVQFFADSFECWKRAADDPVYSVFEGRVPLHANAANMVQLLDSDYWLLTGYEDQSCFNPNAEPEGSASGFFDRMVDQTCIPFQYPFGLSDFVLVVLGADEPAVAPVRPFTNVEMVKLALEHEPHRQVVVYTEQDVDLSAFRNSGRVSVSRSSIDRLLDACAFVISQDSQIALRGFLHRKHCIQMAACGFHHLSRNPYRDQRIKKSFNRVHRDLPEFEKYIKWLFKTQAVNAYDARGVEKMMAKIQNLGW